MMKRRILSDIKIWMRRAARFDDLPVNQFYSMTVVLSDGKAESIHY